MPIKILIVDRNEGVRQALSDLIDRTPEMEPVGVSGDVEDAFALVKSAGPDIVLVESKGQHEDFCTFCERVVKLPNPPDIIVLTSYEDEDERMAARTLGVQRYLLKEIGSAALVQEIRAAFAESHLNA